MKSHISFGRPILLINAQGFTQCLVVSEKTLELIFLKVAFISNSTKQHPDDNWQSNQIVVICIYINVH